jgi:hypothetical protein
MNRNDVLTDEEDGLLEACEHSLMENIDDEYYYFERSILEKYIQGHKFELIKTSTYYRNRNEILYGLAKKKNHIYEFEVDTDTGKISVKERRVMDSKKLKRDSKESDFDYIGYLKEYINNLTNSKKKLQSKIDEINDKITELKTILKEKEDYASLEEREIDY